MKDWIIKNALPTASFGKQAIMADLLYFKYYFLDALRQAL